MGLFKKKRSKKVVLPAKGQYVEDPTPSRKSEYPPLTSLEEIPLIETHEERDRRLLDREILSITAEHAQSKVHEYYNPHSYISDLGRAFDKIWEACKLGQVSVCLKQSDRFDRRVMDCLEKEGFTITKTSTPVDVYQDVQWTVSWAKKENEND